MKNPGHLILFLLTLSIACRADSTNLFGIYLTAEPVDPRITAYAKGDWSQVKLAESPVISGADVVSYDFTNHLITLTPDAIKRLPRPPVSGTPFVVVANGERIYIGVFMTIVSSVSRAVPSIEVDGYALSTNRATTNTFHISRGYGAPPPAGTPDPRGDARIKSALNQLKKRREISNINETNRLDVKP